MATVLIVDDEAPVRKMLRMLMEKAGHEVDVASDGLEKAMRSLRQSARDVVIIDVVMPNKEGLETIREIRENWPETHIIAISAGDPRGVMDYLAVAKRLGADMTFSKPFDRQAIVEAVGSL